MNLRLDLAYDGRPFHGFARQPDVRTVQGDLEEALGRVVGGEVKTFAAGRTDAGVHALGQVVSVPDLPDDLDLVRIRDALNGMLAPAVCTWSATSAADDFHARFSARSRTYIYGILQAPVPDPFLAPTTLFHPGALDVAAMNEAAGHLVGPHDFSSFGRVPEPDASAERLLYELRCARDGDLVRVRARANAFIQQMVRSLVGTLIQVGEGRTAPDSVPAVLAAGDRAAAGPVAPPHGLCLVAVEYDDAWKAPFEGASQG
ncbi:MAG TPA: tRNA pseudouridine(38-40) synthase TruA [Actinomycetota bacterium]|nr:tRNA pseudouridine(38-40) synthase TruA [Actinomycetota bacterium]